MALDTRDKRSSAVDPLIPWRTSMPTPSGTVGASAREIVALLCSAILTTTNLSVLKRMSAIHIMCPWRNLVPLPDGVVDVQDRPVIALLYSRASDNPSGTGDVKSFPFIANVGTMMMR